MLRSVLMIVIVLAMIAGSAAVAQEAACDEGAIRANVQRIIDEGFNQGDVSVLDEVVTDDYISHPDEEGRDSFKAEIAAWRSAAPDLQAWIDAMLVEGCNVFFAFHMSGTMTDALELPGQDAVPATDEPLNFTGHVYLRMNEQAQIVEEWDYFDNLGLLMQIGVIPMPDMDVMMPEEMVAEQPVTTTGSEAELDAMVRQSYEEVFQIDFEDMDAFYAADYVGHRIDGSVSTMDALNAEFAVLQQAIPDAHMVVAGGVSQGNYVALRTTFNGTFQNPLGEGDEAIPPTGAPIMVHMSFFHHVDDAGVILEDWEMYDQMSMLAQLGLLEMGME